MKPRIMYIERKNGQLAGGVARIGRVRYSKTGKTLYYGALEFASSKGHDYKANHFVVGTGDLYWISGPKRDGSDRLYGERVPVHIDDDVRAEYWTTIRNRAEDMDKRSYVPTVPKKYQN